DQVRPGKPLPRDAAVRRGRATRGRHRAQRTERQPGQILLGIVRLDQGKIDAALPLLHGAAQRIPKRAVSRLTAAVKYRATGNLAESVRMLEQVTQDRPDWALAHFELGETFSALKQFDRARQAYARARQAIPATT